MIYSGIKKDTQDCARLCAYPPPELEGCPKGGGVIGHVTRTGAVLVTPDGGELPLTAPGF